MLLQELKTDLEATNYADLKDKLEKLGLGEAFEAGKKKSYIIDRALELHGAKDDNSTQELSKEEALAILNAVAIEEPTPTADTANIDRSIDILKANLVQTSNAEARERTLAAIAKLEALKTKRL